MNKITFYDTETTGLPEWKIPSGDKKQPHLVSLTAIQCNANTEEILQRIDLIVRPNGWEIPQEVVDIHGITTEKAKDCGVYEPAAAGMLLELCRDSVRVSHNRTFDQRIIRIALKRYQDNETIEKWAEKEDHKCTMLMSKPIMELPPRGKWGWKNPKLEEAYKYFTGKTLENAHSSSADTGACMEIYFAMTREKPEETKSEEPVENPCPSCGKEWSNKLKQCPHCGEVCPF